MMRGKMIKEGTGGQNDGGQNDPAPGKSPADQEQEQDQESSDLSA